jgi:antitoxin VapB
VIITNNIEIVKLALIWEISPVEPCLLGTFPGHTGLGVHTRSLGIPLIIRNEVVNQLAERLAARKQMNETEAVRVALENELRRLEEVMPLRDRLRPLQARVLSRPPTGLQADKAFYDELSGTVD